jgi:hypothetical protein
MRHFLLPENYSRGFNQPKNRALIFTWHVPPFAQGLCEHSLLILLSQFVPEYPGGQLHVYEPCPVFLQVAPFLHGRWLVQ